MSEAVASRRRSERGTLGLISAAHLISHFHMLVLPPLFPLLKALLHVDYVQLGFALTLSNVVGAVLQTPVGFLTDRLGGRTMLVGGLVLGGLGYSMFGLWTTYPVLLAAAVMIGLANTVYHPADYAVLSARIPHARMGRAFAVHTFAGYLGFAIAPMTMLAAASWFGLHGAILSAGLVALACAVLLLPAGEMDEATRARPMAGSEQAPNVSLMTPAIGALVLFFALLAISGNSIGNFGAVALIAIYGMNLGQANIAVSVFLFSLSFGVLAGGLVADRTHHHAAVAAIGFGACAVVTIALGLVSMPVLLLMGAMGLSGFLAGIITPSRDLLVRALAPPGTAGRVFGVVTTGFLIGNAVMPLLFGWIMDLHAPRFVFLGAAGFMILAVLLALVEGRGARRKSMAAV